MTAEVIDMREWKIAKTETQPATAPSAVDPSHEDDMRVLRERRQLREEEKRQRREEKRRLREQRQRPRGDEDLRTLVKLARRLRQGRTRARASAWSASTLKRLRPRRLGASADKGESK